MLSFVYNTDEFARLAELSALEHLDLSDNQLDFNLQQLYFFLILPLKQCHALKSLDLNNNPSAKLNTQRMLSRIRRE